MGIQIERLKREIHKRIEKSRASELRSIERYIRLIQHKGPIDLDQVYFWSRGWQKLERRADRDKTLGHIIGDGTTEGMIRSLRR